MAKKRLKAYQLKLALPYQPFLKEVRVITFEEDSTKTYPTAYEIAKETSCFVGIFSTSYRKLNKQTNRI